MVLVLLGGSPSPAVACGYRQPRNSKLRVRAQSGSASPEQNGCPCGCACGRTRRGLLRSASLSALSLSLSLPLSRPFSASAAPPPDPTAVLEMLHPSRPDFYEQMYATAMNSGMKAYETQIASYKEKLFSSLTATTNNLLELGVGTGPNFKYYANRTDLIVTGVDPNKQMEKYARSSAATAGLPPANFNFIRAVGEALPVDDNSMDAVVGTLVLCSVTDVDATLKEVKRVLKPDGQYIFIEHVAAQDGTFLRFVQGVVDPLQQVVADGCHLTRETGKQIAGVGFSRLNVNNAFLKSVSLFGPHVYGVACK